MDFNKIGKEANAIEDRLGLSIDAVLHKVSQESGEFNDAVQKLRGIYCKTPGTIDSVKGELGDLLFNLVSVSYRLGIDPNEFADYAASTLEKFKEREELYRDVSKGKY